MKINQVVDSKAIEAVISISPDSTVRELLALLAAKNIGAVIVSQDGHTIQGMVSERDVVRKLNDNDQVLSAHVSEIMTEALHTCTGEDSVDHIRAVMTEHRVRHIPVLEKGNVVGVVSIGDIVKSHIDQVEFERDQLDSYVHQT